MRAGAFRQIADELCMITQASQVCAREMPRVCSDCPVDTCHGQPPMLGSLRLAMASRSRGMIPIGLVRAHQPSFTESD